MIDFKTYNACAIDTSDDVIILDSIDSEPASSVKVASAASLGHGRLTPHECSPSCVEYEDTANLNLDQYTAFQRPIVAGWHRFGSGASPRYYRTPCLRYLYSMGQIDEYLLKTNSKLRIDCFDLTKCDIPIINDIVEVSVRFNQFSEFGIGNFYVNLVLLLYCKDFDFYCEDFVHYCENFVCKILYSEYFD